MSPIEITLIALAIIFSSMMFGMYLRPFLQEHHVDAMKLGTNMIATMAAIVLGLLIGSAKGTFDTMNSGLKQAALKIVLLDRTLAQYGPETREARDSLRRSVRTTIRLLWPDENKIFAVDKIDQSKIGIEDFQGKLWQLSPRNADQGQLKSQALQINGAINEIVLIMVEQVGERSFPMPLFGFLVSWLAIIFFNFGLITSPNIAVIIVLFVCVLSAASSLFLILELDQPFGELITVSSAPLLKSLALIGR